MQVFRGVDELAAAVGTTIGVSEWFTLDQARIDGFADATDDHQWIHVDRERSAQGPFGATIAHGFLTLALLPVMIKDVYRVDGVQMGVNYGLNRVRFTSPVVVGSRVRGEVELAEVGEVSGVDAVQVVNRVTVQIENGERPALVADWITRQYR